MCTRQVRSYYVDWRMLRDVKRRKLAYEYADERLRINAIRKNAILPKELQVPGSCARPGQGTSPRLAPAAMAGAGRSGCFMDPSGRARPRALALP